MSPLAENNKGEGAFQAFDNLLKMVVLKNGTAAKCLVVSSYVQTLKHKVKQQLISHKWLFVCFLKQLFPG